MIHIFVKELKNLFVLKLVNTRSETDVSALVPTLRAALQYFRTVHRHKAGIARSSAVSQAFLSGHRLHGTAHRPGRHGSGHPCAFGIIRSVGAFRINEIPVKHSAHSIDIPVTIGPERWLFKSERY